MDNSIITEKDFYLFNNAIKEGKKQIDLVKCILCLKNYNLVNSHTVPKSLLRNFSKLYYLDRTEIYIKSFISQIKYSKINEKDINKKMLKTLDKCGTFSQICEDCENSIDKYENNIVNNINTSLSQKDINELAMKSFLSIAYSNSLILKIHKEIKSQNKPFYKVLKKEWESTINIKELAKKIQNGEEQWKIIWDSSDKNINLNLKIGLYSILNIVNNKNQNHLLLAIVLPGKKSSRLILISSEKTEFSDIFTSEKVKEIINLILLNTVKNYCIGMILSSINDLDNTDFYKNIINMDRKNINYEKIVQSIIKNNKYDFTNSSLIFKK